MHVQPFKYSLVDRLRSFTILSNPQSLTIRNTGNYFALPTLKIYGNGIVTVGLDNIQIFTISLGSEGYIFIDCEKMEAYKGSTLKNRIVLGNYDNFKLQPGLNTINLTGAVSQVDISNFSRWI